MRLLDYLAEVASAVQAGEAVDLELLLLAAGRIRDKMDSLRRDPDLPGIEALDRALLDAADLYEEALDLLILAASEANCDAAEQSTWRVQEAADTLAMVRQAASHQRDLLDEELPMTDGGW